jgi:hypothetical protein
MHGNVPVRFGRGRLDSLGNKGLAAYLMCAVAQVCLVLPGVPRPRWKKAGKTIRLPSSERSEGTTACGRSDVRPSVKGRKTFAS